MIILNKIESLKVAKNATFFNSLKKGENRKWKNGNLELCLT